MALDFILTVKEKPDESLNDHFGGDIHEQWGTMEKDEPVSPTAEMYSIFITASIEVVGNRNTAVVNLPGAYLGADMDDKEEVLVVLCGPLIELMALAAPQVYDKCAPVKNNGRQILYVKLQKAYMP